MLVPNNESDIATTLSEHCLNKHPSPTLGSGVATTSTQHCLNVGQCDNIVSMLGFWSKYNIGTMFTQHCLDAHTVFLGRLKVATFERCHNIETDIETTLACDNIATTLEH